MIPCDPTATKTSASPCTPEDTWLTDEKIPGARFTVMTEVGHFPMAEHPAQFRRCTLPVLDEIRSAAR
ncbi:MAG: alpha/beta fold hydrolase [Candidatus Rokuibacteriota bacterium]